MNTGLVIVAHPDDETIWMGGTLLTKNDVKWTIFSLCRKNDKDRAPKFKRVCRHYKARGIISDLEDEGIMNIKQSLPEIKKRIVKESANWRKEKENFTYIFTHGYNGEYGHLRHIGVHKVVKKLVQDKILSCDKLFFFNYRLNSQGKIVNSNRKSAALTFNLDKKTLKTKKDIIKNIYGFSKNSFENKSCLARETFYENTHLIRTPQ